jgi:hypothetical protein
MFDGEVVAAGAEHWNGVRLGKSCSRRYGRPTSAHYQREGYVFRHALSHSALILRQMPKPLEPGDNR